MDDQPDTYEIGQRLLVKATFRDLQRTAQYPKGALVDPVTVTFTAFNQDTGDILTMAAAVSVETGVWTSLGPVLTTAGTYCIRVVGSGGVDTAKTHFVFVEPLPVVS